MYFEEEFYGIENEKQNRKNFRLNSSLDSLAATLQNEIIHYTALFS
jgi:hypothetical protein